MTHNLWKEIESSLTIPFTDPLPSLARHEELLRSIQLPEAAVNQDAVQPPGLGWLVFIVKLAGSRITEEASLSAWQWRTI